MDKADSIIGTARPRWAPKSASERSIRWLIDRLGDRSFDRRFSRGANRFIDGVVVRQVVAGRLGHEVLGYVEFHFGSHLGRAVPMMLSALSTYHAGMPQIVIAGEAEAPDTRALFDALRVAYRPAAVVVPAFGQHRMALERVLPWVQPMAARDGRATAYVCRDFVCQSPVQTAEALVEQLGA